MWPSSQALPRIAIALVRCGAPSHLAPVELTRIYQCFSDSTRLRILNLLCRGPLCVCHFQELLNEPQVKISKHLAYLRAHNLVEVKREKVWMVYSLPWKLPRELDISLAALRDCVRDDPVFRRDIEKLESISDEIEKSTPICRPETPRPAVQARSKAR